MDKMNHLIPCCDTCREIIVQGYSDAIENEIEHQERCNDINNQLAPGYYYLGTTTTDRDAHGVQCGTCGVMEAQHVATAVHNGQ